MAVLRIHNKKSYTNFQKKTVSGDLETVFLEYDKFVDIQSEFITEDIFNKIESGILKMEVRRPKN